MSVEKLMGIGCHTGSTEVWHLQSTSS